jgi:hypothetical protein
LWALWIASKLTREGLEVAYFSEENPLEEDLRRLGRLAPTAPCLRFYHGQSIDLADSEHFERIHEAVVGCVLVVFDTLSACWSGDENDNAAIAKLDRDRAGAAGARDRSDAAGA